MVNIRHRPVEAEDRTVVGHWEGDLIIGKNNTSAIGTLVERSSGLTMLVHLPHGYKSDQVLNPLIAQLKTMPSHMLRSLTWDQGAEMLGWKQIAAAAGIDIYFCDPHSPWQRGTNENTNGLLRQYFPKKTIFNSISNEEINEAMNRINNRPRKRHGFISPNEIFQKLKKQDSNRCTY
jgi:IS30 family transposase